MQAGTGTRNDGSAVRRGLREGVLNSRVPNGLWLNRFVLLSLLNGPRIGRRLVIAPRPVIPCD
jgi:hypothetical protein